MELLERLVTVFAENGYLAVFVALLLCGAGVPLPEDITLVAGGVITGLGYGNVHVMVGIGMAGVLVGDAGMFLLGHHYGARIRQWRFVARVLTPERYAKVQEKFERYGNRMMFIARFLPGMRTAVFITAGSTHRVSFLRFFLLDGAAALISVPFWVYLGYLGADNHEWLEMWIRRGQNGIWLFCGVVFAVVLALWWRHKRRMECEPGPR
ncbi:DedA family protein [Dyella solisilvae]|uniref:DedA family protein n=1 Tax=Dyella solisilvae TaxID=1920168 RepID=A0A370K7K9_9GAMM|nr:DedA family protein [Dyella solisilvae]RDI98622.1 DedA family protein [Dyella solisilvae]